MVLLGKELFPQSPWIWIGALALYCLSGYCILWDTVIRSYSAAAMCVAALAWASIRCARGPRWKTMGGLSALAIALGFWTNYVTLVHLPGIALAAWIVSGFSPKAFWRILGVFAAGVALAALVWGRGFLGQLGKSPSPGLLAFPILESLDYQTTAMALHYWSMAFSQAIWEWLAAGRMEDGFNVLSNLSPLNPVLYSLAFLAYGAGLFANGWALARRPGLALAALALLAFAPAAIVIGGNTILPHSFRLHGRHMAPAAPMFFLFLAHGWAACGGAAIRRLGRQAGHNRVEQA